MKEIPGNLVPCVVGLLSQEIMNAAAPIMGLTPEQVGNLVVSCRSINNNEQGIGQLVAVRCGDSIPDQVVVDAIAAHNPQSALNAVNPQKTDLITNAQTAIDAFDQYLAIADTATAGQVRDQVKRLTQVTRKILLRLVQV